MNAVKELAYAKVNLYLDILDKREDGYHSISTVMHTVSLADEITVQLVGMGKRNIKLMLSNNKFLPTDSKNLCYAAADAFMQRAGISADILIRLKKRIPIGGGLGGGSADAAAVLKAMNRLFRKPFTDKALLSIAATLGSDVPFCFVGGTALCEGRGERMTRLDSALDLHLAVVNSGEHVSTPWAYKELDRHYSDFDGSVKTVDPELLPRFIKAVAEGNIADVGSFNAFEAPILSLCPKASRLKQMLLEKGAEFALMSGSGSTIFAAFKDEQSARNAVAHMRLLGAYANYANSTK